MLLKFLESDGIRLDALKASQTRDVWNAYQDYCRKHNLIPECRRIQDLNKLLLHYCPFLGKHRCSRGVMIVGLDIGTARRNTFWHYTKFKS
jgi:hypothetical protein